MEDPIKVIHRFKNNNRKIQYMCYIFLGSLVNEDIKKAIEKFKNLNFIDMLEKISQKDYKLLENKYGKYWYRYFFISQHIKNSKNKIKNNNKKRLELIKKFNKDWFITHIDKKPTEKKIISFTQLYYKKLIDKGSIKKFKEQQERDFRTYIDNDMYNMILGGADIEQKEEEEVIEESDIEEEIEEDFDATELNNLYAQENDETNKEITKTTELISKVLKDKKYEKNIENIENKYNDILDNSNYEMKIENSYNKYYIYNEYIFKNDTIKNIRNKICISLPVNENLKAKYFLPEFQYLYTEYSIANKKDRIMIGQKWSRRNELLKIDIVPNENLNIYADLRKNLSYLRSNFGYKLKREDDETAILDSYSEYIDNNEIFMIDLLNEMNYNITYNQKQLQNLIDVYIYIYFPLLLSAEFKELLNNNKDLLQKFNNRFNVIKNDMTLEKKIYTIIENDRNSLKKDTKYMKNYLPTNIIQSILHINITNKKNRTGTFSNDLNLFRIFDNFIVSKEYPFLCYQLNSSEKVYKFYNKIDKIENKDNILKWFQNEKQGISFTIYYKNKYVTVTMYENGRMEYKITWKENEKITVENVKETYIIIKNLLKKINKENRKINIVIPEDEKFKYAFVNTIQKFYLPKNYKINHNDFSDFCRFFYPYIALQIEPKKRESKLYQSSKSKYGTYLRYKKINKYENRQRMQLRILWYLKNYDITEKKLADEIAKQFNITISNALTEIEETKKKFSKALKRSSSLPKKLKSIPKAKPPGIEIEIQGRSPENYKFRITGARNKGQLFEIVDFLKVLLYTYSMTYLLKKSKYQKIKDILKKLTNIAKRRNKVNEIVNYESSMKNVKAITSLDKDRLGFRPEEGQNQWTRSCQNSGKDKKRRPNVTSGNRINELISQGYKLNKKTKFYEKNVNMVIKGKRYKTTLRAAPLPNKDGSVNFYTCDPSINNEHMFIGFLSKSNNPNDLCMPCCFKKDQMTGTNKFKKNYYKKCIGDKKADEKIEKAANPYKDKIYILQETNKIQEGRYIFLEPSMNRLFNTLWKHDKTIVNHYLNESKSGYFFKFMVKDNYYNFLAAMSNIYDTDIDSLKKLMITKLKNDINNKIFNYLNNGTIASTFDNTKDYIKYISSSFYLGFNETSDLLSIPGVLSKKGIFYYVFKKIKNNYYIKCTNNENSHFLDKDRDIVILINDGKYYFPIYLVKLDKKISKKVIIIKKINTKVKEEYNKLFEELYKYYNESCKSIIINKINNSISNNNKLLINILENNKITIKNQIYDNRFKTRYIMIVFKKDKLLIPTEPSGLSYKYINTNIHKFNNYNKIELVLKHIYDLNKIINKDYIPKYLVYNSVSKGTYIINAIQFKNKLIIPVKETKVKDIDKLKKKYNLLIRFSSLEEKIDRSIMNNNINNKRRLNVKKVNYMNEGYNLFRLEVSNFFIKNTTAKNKVIDIVRDTKMKTNDKYVILKKILINIINKKLDNNAKINLKIQPIATLIKNIPKLDNYDIDNIRDTCNNLGKKECSSNPHCLWKNNKCNFALTIDMAKDYINKILYEIVRDNIEFKELIQEDDYFISDIVDFSIFNERPNQKIIKSNNFNLQKILKTELNYDNIPVLGKKRFNMNIENNFEEELNIYGDIYIQLVVPNNNSVIRSYVNCLYWITNSLYNTSSRNLGYKSKLQEQITNLLKYKIVEFIQNNRDNTKFSKFINKQFPKKKNYFSSNLNKFIKKTVNTDGSIELYILSILYDFPIILFDKYNNIFKVYLQGKVYDSKFKNFKKNSVLKNSIIIKMEFEDNSNVPKNIYSVYY